MSEIVEHCDLPIASTADISIDAKNFNPEAFSVTLALKGFNTKKGKWLAPEEAGFRVKGTESFQRVKSFPLSMNSDIMLIRKLKMTLQSANFYFRRCQLRK